MTRPYPLQRQIEVHMLRQAGRWFNAATALEEDLALHQGGDDVGPFTVPYSYGHCLELTFKAFLAFNGLDPKAMSRRGFGHRLAKVARLSRNLGLQGPRKNIKAARSILCVMDAYATDYGFRYVKMELYGFPYLDRVHRLCRSYLEEVAMLTTRDLVHLHLRPMMSPEKRLPMSFWSPPAISRREQKRKWMRLSR